MHNRRSARLATTAAALVVALLLVVPAASAKTFVVDSFTDAPDASAGDEACLTADEECTLRAAIQQANALAGADTVEFAAGGTYTLDISGANEDQAASGDLDILDDLTLQGPSLEPADIIIDGNGSVTQDRVIHVLNNAEVELAGLTIQNGRIENGNGAGLLVTEGSTVTLTDVRVLDNFAGVAGGDRGGSGANQGNGGGIFNAGTMTLENVDISGNQAKAIGGAGGGGISNMGRMDIQGGVISNNSGEPGAGGVQNTGGAGQVATFARITFTGTVIKGNATPGIGGGLRNQFGNMVLDHALVEDNLANGSGAGIDNSGGRLLVSRSIIRNNGDGNNPRVGAGLANWDIADITQSLVTGNEVLRHGGGVYNSGPGTLTITNSTITANQAGTRGGGLYNQREADITNVTFYNNSTPGEGKEIFTCDRKDNQTQECILGAETQNPTETKLVNTIIAHPSASGLCAGDVGLIRSQGNNLENADSCNLSQSSDLVNTDPGLDPNGLADNDGATQTLALTDASAAVDAGNDERCPLNDQRNYLRGDDGNSCDIGAYEISNTPVDDNLADMRLSMDFNLTQVPNGGHQLSYTFTIRNMGPQNASEVTLNVKLSPDVELSSTNPNQGSCSQTTEGFRCALGNLNAFDSLEVFALTIPQVANQTVQTEADVSARQADPLGTNNTATVQTDIGERESRGTSGGSNGGDNFGNNDGGGGGGLGYWPALLVLPWLRRR